MMQPDMDPNPILQDPDAKSRLTDEGSRGWLY